MYVNLKIILRDERVKMHHEFYNWLDNVGFNFRSKACN